MRKKIKFKTKQLMIHEPKKKKEYVMNPTWMKIKTNKSMNLNKVGGLVSGGKTQNQKIHEP
jgi:hypothetical protein